MEQRGHSGGSASVLYPERPPGKWSRMLAVMVDVPALKALPAVKNASEKVVEYRKGFVTSQKSKHGNEATMRAMASHPANKPLSARAVRKLEKAIPESRVRVEISNLGALLDPATPGGSRARQLGPKSALYFHGIAQQDPTPFFEVGFELAKRQIREAVASGQPRTDQLVPHYTMGCAIAVDLYVTMTKGRGLTHERALEVIDQALALGGSTRDFQQAAERLAGI
jgi:hypothetical protein